MKLLHYVTSSEFAERSYYRLHQDKDAYFFLYEASAFVQRYKTITQKRYNGKRVVRAWREP